jgi:hypothetical protein
MLSKIYSTTELQQFPRSIVSTPWERLIHDLSPLARARIQWLATHRDTCKLWQWFLTDDLFRTREFPILLETADGNNHEFHSSNKRAIAITVKKCFGFGKVLKLPSTRLSDVDLVKLIISRLLKEHSHLEKRGYVLAQPVFTKKKNGQWVGQWITQNYMRVQNARHGIFKRPETYLENDGFNFYEFDCGESGAERIDHCLARYFRYYALRVPEIPAGYGKELKYLYRGHQGPQKPVGVWKWKGYLAFSREPPVYHKFMRLAIKDIPPGTPWIWFRTYNSTWHGTLEHSDVPEVLLPPGKLIKKPSNSGYIDVRYVPDTLASSILDPKIKFIRRLGPPRLDSNDMKERRKRKRND